MYKTLDAIWCCFITTCVFFREAISTVFTKLGQKLVGIIQQSLVLNISVSVSFLEKTGSCVYDIFVNSNNNFELEPFISLQASPPNIVHIVEYSFHHFH